MSAAARHHPPARRGQRGAGERMATLCLMPAWTMALALYVGTLGWTVWLSLTDSHLLPINHFVGLAQYRRLWNSARWLISAENLVIFGVGFIGLCLLLGVLLAICLDQKVRFENTLRSIFLYPYATSFIITGLVWQWLLNPAQGIPAVLQGLGWTSGGSWLGSPRWAIFAIVLAGVWQASGMVMVIVLAGLRGIDENIWKAARIEGIPAHRVYRSIALPMIKPTLVMTTVLLSLSVIKAYDLVVAMTKGGPGMATEVPAKYIMTYLFERQNIALASAATCMMLLTAAMVLLPWVYATRWKRRRPSKESV